MWCGGDTYVSNLIESVGGTNLLRNRGRYPTMDLDCALALEPKHIDALKRLAEIQQRRGNYQEVERLLKQAIDQKPSAEILIERARAADRTS